MVFQVKGHGIFKLRVVAPSGKSATLSTGMYLRSDAADVEAMVERWKGKRGLALARPAMLEHLVAKRCTLADAYRWSTEGTLDAKLAELDATGKAVDLTPYVEQWHREKGTAKKGAASADAYLTQFRRLYPPTEACTLGTFTRKELLRRLKQLEVDSPTQNRYKAACSSFAQLLVDEELLEFNFVRTIPGFGENDERVVYYALADAKALLAGLAQPYAAIAAFALGFGAEWGAIARLRAGDVQLKAEPVTARVRGSKRSWRDRVVPLVPELAFVLPYLKPALTGKLPSVHVFAEVAEWEALRAQQAAARELELVASGQEEFGEHTLHDWRHTHAVALLRSGYSEQIAAAHLGHKNTDLIRKRYGLFKPDAHDYATKTATSPRKKAK